MKNATRPTFFVTGASGFVGSCLCRHLAGRYCVAGAYFTHPAPPAGCSMFMLDIRDRRHVRQAVAKIRPSHIIHATALSAPDLCENNPQLAWDINYGGTRFVLEAATEFNCRMVFISTDLVFDGKRGNYTETDEPNPLNLYGRTKEAAERLCMKSKENCIVTRITLQYGMNTATGSSFSDWLLARLNNNQPALLFTDQFRTLTYVEDTARGLEHAALRGDAGELYHLSGPENISRYGFGKKLAATFGFPQHLLKPCTMDDTPACAPRPRDVSLCGKKFAAKFCFMPGDVQQGLDRMLKMQNADKLPTLPQ